MLSGTARDRERPASFRDVLVIGEFRAMYAASTLSWLGDYIARAAITALVFDLTHNVVYSAAAFAISYVPWLLGGSVLVSLAERYPYRAVMVLCDVARTVLMAVVALPVLPLPVVLALLLCSAMFALPFDAARSAMLPSMLPDDRYVVGLALHTATVQPAQVAGYFIGASMASGHPRLALLINAGTFATSAALTHFGVRLRPPALSRERRTHLLRETVDGFRVVFSSPALRFIILIVFCGSVFAVVPEGLGAAWAAQLADDSNRGWVQGVIMGAVPLGAILGALMITRLVRPQTRQKLLRPLAVAIPLILVPAVFDPPVAIAALLAGLASFAMGALVPVANGQFVRALPNAYRARAFGVVQGGLQVLQGTAVLVTGTIAQHNFRGVPMVVGLWSLAGVALMLLLSLSWPAPKVFADAIASAAVSNAAQPPGYLPRHSVEPLAEDTTTPLPEPATVSEPATLSDPARLPEPGKLPEPAVDSMPETSRQRTAGLNGWGQATGGPVTGAARRQAGSRQPGTIEP
jgi:MFS family permease